MKLCVYEDFTPLKAGCVFIARALYMFHIYLDEGSRRRREAMFSHEDRIKPDYCNFVARTRQQPRKIERVIFRTLLVSGTILSFV